MAKEGVSCVMLTEQGQLAIEGMEECPMGDVGHNPVVLYQRGLIPLESKDRSHKALISVFKIDNGDSRANVPWFNFSWSPPEGTPLGLDRSCKCKTHRETCTECIAMVAADNVFVVWYHSNTGERLYQWYAYFNGLKRILTPLPSHCIQRVVKDAKRGACPCGRCIHPIKRMVNIRGKRSIPTFERQATRLFSQYRKLVEGVVDAEKADECKQLTSVPASWKPDAVKEGTCAVCLEETLIADSLCVQHKCTTGLCIDCHKATRGLCPICDRQKLGSGSTFYCYSCDSEHNLGSFGFPCTKCGDACMCSKCSSAYRVCTSCETDMLTQVPKKRKTG